MEAGLQSIVLPFTTCYLWQIKGWESGSQQWVSETPMNSYAVLFFALHTKNTWLDESSEMELKRTSALILWDTNLEQNG